MLAIPLRVLFTFCAFFSICLSNNIFLLYSIFAFGYEWNRAFRDIIYILVRMLYIPCMHVFFSLILISDLFHFVVVVVAVAICF